MADDIVIEIPCHFCGDAVAALTREHVESKTLPEGFEHYSRYVDTASGRKEARAIACTVCIAARQPKTWAERRADEREAAQDYRNERRAFSRSYKNGH